ncbi:MAG TPA: PspC domain-containing protein [Prolixibacteraceae bacterium]|nr:PspC domain-containing protein [Prolixibacteraceae bacterium]
MKRLTRSNEKIIAGVISGISNYINPEWDPVFCRIVFAWIAFYNPAFILIYFGLILIIPAENTVISHSKASSTTTR